MKTGLCVEGVVCEDRSECEGVVCVRAGLCVRE